MTNTRVKELIKKIQLLTEEERKELVKYLPVKGDKISVDDGFELSEEEKTRAFMEATGSWSNIPESILDEIYSRRSIHMQLESKK